MKASSFGYKHDYLLKYMHGRHSINRGTYVVDLIADTHRSNLKE